MRFSDPAVVLAVTAFAVLTLASVVGAVLRRSITDGGTRPVIDNLNARIRAWWVILITLGVAFLLGKAGVITLFALASAVALREYVTLAPTRRSDYTALVVAFFIALPFQYFLLWVEWYGLFAIFIPVYSFLALPIVQVLTEDARDFMRRSATIQWGLMLCVYALSHVPALLTLEIPGFEGRNLLLVAFLLVVVQSSDVLQYVWGKLCGKTPIAPTLSPSKTVEGFVGGIASATALGGALYWITPFSPVQAAAISLVIALMGFLGGLVMSALKRDRGVKDWGTLIEGHGGMLDRLDSVCFAAPVFFHVTRYWWTP
jgi:phosphatidate cytidylyltransferase